MIGIDSGECGARAWGDFWEKYRPQLSKEFEKVHILWQSNNDPEVLHWGFEQPVKTLEEMEGKVVFTYSQPEWIELLGARPTYLSSEDLYSGLEKGVVDGLSANFGPFKSNHWEDVVESITLAYAGVSSHTFAMNLDTYNSFPPEIQKIVDEVSWKQGVAQAIMFDQTKQSTIEWIKTDYPEIEFYDLPAEEKARWTEALSPMHDKWVEQVEALGYPGQQMLDDFKSLCLKYAAPNLIHYQQTSKTSQ